MGAGQSQPPGSNLFGEVVNNSMLERMPIYAGRAITQQDRAREAWNVMYAGEKKARADSYVQTLKNNYGNGVSTLCVVYNATGDKIHLNKTHDWNGHIGTAPYPMEIGNGQWAAFLHVHTSGAATGSVAGIVYRGSNISGENKDFLLSWCTPWGAQRNSAHCEIVNVDYFNNNNWDSLKQRLENSGYASTATSNGCRIDAHTEGGTTVRFTATITAHTD